MKKIKLIILVLFTNLIFANNNCETYKYEYMFNYDFHHKVKPTFYFSSSVDGEFIIEIPAVNYYEVISIKKNQLIKKELMMFGNDGIYYEWIKSLGTEKFDIKSKKCVLIKSNLKLFVYINTRFNRGGNEYDDNDVTQLSPNIYNSQSYFLNNYNNAPNNLNISSFTNNNKISYSLINKSIQNPDNSKIIENEFILNKYESLNLLYAEDFSNIVLESTNPIQVYTYKPYPSIPTISPIHNGNYLDATFDYFLSNNQLGKSYILTPYTAVNIIDDRYLFKIVPLENDCEIKINGLSKGKFNTDEYFESESNKILKIESDKNISVIQYNFSDLDTERKGISQFGYPFQVHILPLTQMNKSIDFIAINLYPQDTIFCNIIGRLNDNILLDKIPIVPISISSDYNSEFYVFKIKLSAGIHNISSKSGMQGVIFSHGQKSSIGYNLINELKRTEGIILINDRFFKDILCFNSPFILSADAPEEAVTFDWTINDTLKVSGKEVNLDLPNAGTYKIKLKIDNDDNQVYEWTTTRLEKIISDLDSVIYLCNDSLSNISMNVIGGGTSKSITWFPSENIKDPTQFNIEFIKPLKVSTKLFYEVIDEHCCTYIDSVDIQITNVYPKINTSQNNICYGDSATLSLDKVYDTMLWNTGESTKDIIVKMSGIYSATVTQGECTNDTNIVINVNPLPILDIDAPNGTILCDGRSIILEAKVPANTKITWNDGTKLAKRTISISGTYTLTAEDLTTGCKNTKSIVVSDIENLKAEIQGDPTFCDGESTTLTIQPQGKSYLWSNGETTQSIVVNNSGNYSATITTDTDCKIDAEIEVEKLPLPTFQILGETIICNNSTTIYPDKDFKFYKWSNGESSKSITINKAGNYDLTVTDNNGCKATQSIEITESTPEINLSNRNIDFGELLFGNSKSEIITSDKDIIFIKNSSIFDVNFQNKNIQITFNPIDIGQFIDTLIIESTGDCKALDTIYIQGICTAEILAKVSNSEGYPGDLVNNTVNLELLQNIPLPKDFNYEIGIQINEDAISIIDATTFNYTNNKLEINIADYINQSQNDEEVKKINSKILLAKNLENELVITNFTTDNPYLIPIRQNGNIKIYEVCLYEERLIQYYNEAIISNITQTNTKLSTYYAGKYTIEITDISGKTTTKEVTTTSDNEEINFNYKLSNGTYIIKITEPGKTQTRKIIFGE